jgi:hypothetical protein
MPPTDPKTSIEAFYEKGNFFRVIHADGVFGGPSPRGLITMSFNNERVALPRRSRIPIKDGVAGPEEILETKGGIFREIETTVMMDIASALSFHEWLGVQVNEVVKQLGLSQDQVARIRGGPPK